jgi:hypothetical protein
MGPGASYREASFAAEGCPLERCSATACCSVITGFGSTLASAKPVAPSGRSASGTDLATVDCDTASCRAAPLGSTSCRGEEPKTITPAAKTSGAIRSTPTLTVSWAHMPPPLVGPLRTIVNPTRRFAITRAASTKSVFLITRLYCGSVREIWLQRTAERSQRRGHFPSSAGYSSNTQSSATGPGGVGYTLRRRHREVHAAPVPG